ncbi:15107_t:CDS:1, partial [Racocetra persica]
MPSHAVLIVVITEVKSSQLCSHGFAKYKLLNEMSYTIQWKYFFPINKQPQIITTGNIVCFLEKFVVENSEQCLTVASANILDTGYSNHEFSIANISSYILHCMLSAFVTRTPQKVNDFIYFGMECLEYNAITSISNIKMKITVLYPFHSIRFQKYLGPSGSNIKLDNVYLISGFIKFSTSGNLMIEATDIDYKEK